MTRESLRMVSQGVRIRYPYSSDDAVKLLIQKCKKHVT